MQLTRGGHWTRALGGAVVALVIGGCSGGGVADEENVIAPAGKEDNFFSNTAREYMATATVPLELEALWADRSEADRMARARQLMEGKTRQIGWFLHVYLIDKSHSDEAGDYGGLRAMVLDGSYETDGLKPDPDDPLKFSYVFSVQVGGTKSLLDKIRSDNGLDASATVFPLRMAKLSNSSVINFSHSAYGAGEWSPDKCDCELESVDVSLEPIEASRDAYLDYQGMLDDDVMDISVHFGWDYHARYDITHSRNVYNWLVSSMGFASPAASYEEYNRLSGPLTRTVTIGERQIQARVSIFRPDPCESWDEDGSSGSWAQAVREDDANKKRSCPNWAWPDPAANANSTTSTGAGNLMASLKQSLMTRDAIIFSGHSGYTYGYALASWYKTSAGDLDPSEIKTLPLPADRSQLFVMSGCDTYHVAQAFRENPNKLGLNNADVVTTTSFSNAADVNDTKDMIEALVGGADGQLSAASYGKLMKDLNPSSTDYGWGNFAMYGVHGIDDNPLANPFGSSAESCTACSADSDCAAGNVCVRLNDSEKVCAVECLHDDGCAEGEVCRKFGSSSTGYLKGMACVPTSLSCTVAPPPPLEPQSFTAAGTLGRGEEQRFSVPVGSAATDVVVTMTGTNDADLYTNFDAAPSLSSYACRPYRYGSAEVCTHERADGAVLELMVRGYSQEASSFELEVTWK